MVAVQSSGCAPIVKAFNEGSRHAEPWQNATTKAAGIRVPAAIGDFLILDALRESNGFATEVADQDILAMQALIAREDGILLCPEGAATAAALVQARESGQIQKEESVMLFNCATGLKYPMPADDQFLDIARPVPYDTMFAMRR